MEVVNMPDLPKIELNDHDTYKTTETLSTGQKCNTILPILLLDSDRPLLVDQPEDWGKLIGDVPTAGAILDRLLQHAQMIPFKGRSYRLTRKSESFAQVAFDKNEKSE